MGISKVVKSALCALCLRGRLFYLPARSREEPNKGTGLSRITSMAFNTPLYSRSKIQTDTLAKTQSTQWKGTLGEFVFRSSFMRWYMPDTHGELMMRSNVHGFMFNNRGCRIFAEIVVISESVHRSHGSWRKTAATIGTHVFQHGIHTILAKSTFECADHGFGGSRRQSLVAMFTYRT